MKQTLYGGEQMELCKPFGLKHFFFKFVMEFSFWEGCGEDIRSFLLF